LLRPDDRTDVAIEEVPQLSSSVSFDLTTAPVQRGVRYNINLIATNANGKSNESETRRYEREPGKTWGARAEQAKPPLSWKYLLSQCPGLMLSSTVISLTFSSLDK